MAATWPNLGTLYLFSLSLPQYALPGPNRRNSQLSSGHAPAATQPSSSAYMYLSLSLSPSQTLSFFLPLCLSLSFFLSLRPPITAVRDLPSPASHRHTRLSTTLRRSWPPSMELGGLPFATTMVRAALVARSRFPGEIPHSSTIFHEGSRCQKVPLNFLVTMVTSVHNESARIVGTLFREKTTNFAN